MKETIVIGAGVIGSAVARELARAGLDVTVLDRSGVAGATTAHGEGNVLVSDKEPGPELLLAQHSRGRWLEVLAELPDPTSIEWDPKGGIVVATTQDGAVALDEFAARQRTAGIRAERLDQQALLAAEPRITPAAVTAWHYPDDAQVQPAGAAAALLADAVRHGARVRTGCAVEQLCVRGDRVVGVRTAAGRIPAELVVNATGPWAAALGADVGAPIDVRPRRGEVLVTTPQPESVRHKVYDADYVGAVGSAHADLQASAVVEATAAGTVLIGSSRRRVGFDERLAPEVLAVLARKAITLFPFLADVPVLRCYGGFRPFVPDHLPVIGEDPRVAGLWHACGHEGAGIGLAPGTADLVRALVTDAEPPVDPAPFRVDRPAVLGAGSVAA